MRTTDRLRWIVALTLTALVWARPAASEPTIRAVRLAEEPEIDGLLDEELWSSVPSVEGFVQFRPQFGEPSPFRTVVQVAFSEEALFVAFRCFDPEPSRIAAAVTARDGELDNDDSVSVLIDSFDDDQTAYFFSTNLLGVQQDGKLADNGRTVDDDWDAAWRSASSRFDAGWTTELAIPFEILKYRGADQRPWGINLQRHVPRRLELSMWSGPSESSWRVSSFGALTGLEPPKRASKRWAVIPYGILSAETEEKVETRAGVDLRYQITSNLGADVTLNPDFALVEADVEQINLTRFELSLPEKRPFFLEGLEVFRQRIRQVYTRRIGDMAWGGKLIGTFGGLRVAALAARADLEQEAPPGTENGTQAADYGVLRLQRGVFGSSTIGALAANRHTPSGNAGSIGLDATLFFSDKLGFTGQLIRSHGPAHDGALGWFLRPSFDSANSHFHVRYTNLDVGLRDNINAIGFLRDDDRRELDTNVGHTAWFQGSFVEKLNAHVNYNRYWSQEGTLRSWELDAETEANFGERWDLELSHEEAYELYEKEFRNQVTTLELGFDDRAGKSLSVKAGRGRNYDSDLSLAGVELELGLSSRGTLSYELTWLELDPDPELESTWIHVIGADLHFTNDLFLKLFWQTNSVIEKKNAQAVLVWRFVPPFGSLQVAYQRGRSGFGTRSEQGDTLFTKLSWVF